VTTRQASQSSPRFTLNSVELQSRSLPSMIRMNQVLIEHLTLAPGEPKPPGKSKARTLRRSSRTCTCPHEVGPAYSSALENSTTAQPAHCTPSRPRGIGESAARCAEMIAEALGGGGGRIVSFAEDGWARPGRLVWKCCANMLTHEAHHRGQVCMLAHQLGFPLPIRGGVRDLDWERLWKEGGSPGGPGRRFLGNRSSWRISPL